MNARGRLRCWLVRGAAAAAVVLALQALPDSASAIAYTLDAPVTITGTEPGNHGGSGLIGVISPVTDFGVLDVVSQDVFLFKISIDSSSPYSLDELGVYATALVFPGPVPEEATSAGSFGPGVAPRNAYVPAGIYQSRYDYGNAQNSTTPPVTETTDPSFFLDPSQTSTTLYLTHSAGALSGLGQVNFMVSPTGNDFTKTGQLAVVPEPSSALLLAGALGGLAYAARRRRGRS